MSWDPRYLRLYSLSKRHYFTGWIKSKFKLNNIKIWVYPQSYWLNDNIIASAHTCSQVRVQCGARKVALVPNGVINYLNSSKAQQIICYKYLFHLKPKNYTIVCSWNNPKVANSMVETVPNYSIALIANWFWRSNIVGLKSPTAPLKMYSIHF